MKCPGILWGGVIPENSTAQNAPIKHNPKYAFVVNKNANEKKLINISNDGWLVFSSFLHDDDEKLKKKEKGWKRRTIYNVSLLENGK